MKQKMAWEWNWPTCWDWKHQITVFDCDLRIAKKGDHSPGIWFLVIIFNLKLIDCGYYNVYHEDS